MIAGQEDYFEYSRIKCARFLGNDMSEFIDQKEFGGALYEQVENAMKFAKTHIAKSGKIRELQRIDKFEVPLEAIRESIINAVVHRDYCISGADIKFAIFDSRIEITSPGALPKALEIKEILSGRSEIRNRVIARFFKEIHFIEQWGTGIGKILRSCRDAGLKTPEFIESGLFFKVILFKGGAGSSQKTSQKTSQKIIITMKKNPAVTINKLSEITGVSDRTVKTHIKNLKARGVIRRVGPYKGGYWEVKQ